MNNSKTLISILPMSPPADVLEEPGAAGGAAQGGGTSGLRPSSPALELAQPRAKLGNFSPNLLHREKKKRAKCLPMLGFVVIRNISAE